MWEPETWLEAFERASQERDAETLRELRVDVFRSTVAAVRGGGYELDGIWIDLDEDGYAQLRRETAYYERSDRLTVPADRRGAHETSVDVIDADCLEIARDLGTAEAPAAVLNMASRRNPGGGVATGAGAQEENLFRRSTLYQSLYPFAPYADQYDVPTDPAGHAYPIPRESGGIYSSPICVFRSSEATGYAFLREPYAVAIVSVPAISRPELVESDGQLWLSEEMADATRIKIRAILRIAAHHGHADLVLSAFGCGAFRNPPQHVADLFRETLVEEEFDGVFRNIVFAIFDDHNAGHRHNPEGNFWPFARAFGVA